MSNAFDWSTFDPNWPTLETDDQVTADLPAVDTAKRCYACRVEWCDYLDAYFGKDPWLAEFCVKCRAEEERRRTVAVNAPFFFGMKP